MNTATKTVEGLITYLAHKLSGPAHVAVYQPTAITEGERGQSIMMVGPVNRALEEQINCTNCEELLVDMFVVLQFRESYNPVTDSFSPQLVVRLCEACYDDLRFLMSFDDD